MRLDHKNTISCGPHGASRLWETLTVFERLFSSISNTCAPSFGRSKPFWSFYLQSRCMSYLSGSCLRTDVHCSLKAAILHYAASSLCALVTKLFIGPLGGRYDKTTLIVISSLITVVGWLCLLDFGFRSVCSTFAMNATSKLNVTQGCLVRSYMQVQITKTCSCFLSKSNSCVNTYSSPDDVYSHCSGGTQHKLWRAN